MFAFGCFDKFMLQNLPYIEKESYEIPITIGILICDLRQQFCKENILNYLNHFNRFSDKYINFYIPGYCSRDEMESLRVGGYDKFYADYYNLRGKEYYFSEKYFDEFIYQLREKYNIVYAGEPELILVEVVNGQVNWSKKIRFQLLSLQKKGKIDTVYKFFDMIFELAKKYVALEDFSRAGRRDKLKDSFFHVVQKSIPEYITILNENDKIYRIE